MSSDYPHYVLTIATDGKICLLSHLGEIARGGVALTMVRTLLYSPNKTVNPRYHHVTDSIMAMIARAAASSSSIEEPNGDAGNDIFLDELASRFVNSGLWGVLK